MMPRTSAEACSGRYRALVALLDRAVEEARRAGVDDPLPTLLGLAGANCRDASALVGALRGAFSDDEERVWRWLLEARPGGLGPLTTPLEAITAGRARDVLNEITRLVHGVAG